MTTETIQRSESGDVGRLRELVHGQVIAAGDDGYEAARRVYNAMIDRHPLAVVRCADADDVAACVRFAREHDLPLAVRGGGHSVPGFGTVDDGVVADLSGLRGVTVDPVRRTARVQGGATWSDFNDAGNVHGLATTGGIISTTGVAGLTLGGGIGYLARGYGLSCDNLLSARLVTADGRIVAVSADDNADLFWAIRGGGGNFGVATELEFRLHPVRDIYGGPMFYDLKDAGTVLRFFRDFIAGAPEAFGGFPGFHLAPPLPFVPEARHFTPVLAIVACWSGPLEEGEAVLRPLHDVAEVVAEHVGPMPYPALNAAFDGLVPAGLQHYWKANFVDRLSDAAIASHLEHGSTVSVVNTMVHLYPVNGAVHQVAPDATAFAYRDATFATVIAGMWPDPAQNEANVAWVRDYAAATAPLSEEGGYINFMAADDQDRIRANYRGNYDRLAAIKRAWDPEDVFRVNQNIRPAPGGQK